MKNICLALVVAVTVFLPSVFSGEHDRAVIEIPYSHASQLGLSNDPRGYMAMTKYFPDDVLYITYHDEDLDIRSARTLVIAQLIQTVPGSRRRIVKKVPLSVPAPPEPVGSKLLRDIYTGDQSLDVFFPGPVYVIVQAMTPGGVKYLRSSVIHIADDEIAPLAQKRIADYYTSMIGFSNDPFGDHNLAEYYPDEYIYIYVMDNGLLREDPKTRVTARLVQKRRRPGEKNVVRKVTLQRADARAEKIDIDLPALYKGFIPLDAFRPGYAQLFIDASSPGSMGLTRQSAIRIMELVD